MYPTAITLDPYYTAGKPQELSYCWYPGHILNQNQSNCGAYLHTSLPPHPRHTSSLQLELEVTTAYHGFHVNSGRQES